MAGRYDMRHAKQMLASLSIGFGLLMFSAAAAPAAYAQDATATMPNAPGKDVTIRTCTKCHAITNITGQHKDSDGWTATITKMVGYGASASDDEFQQILDYVTKYYGVNPPPADAAGAAHAKIVVNKETAAQLTTDLGLTDAEAAAVVDYRTKNGDFKTIDDLKKVPSVDGKKFDAHSADLQFS